MRLSWTLEGLVMRKLFLAAVLVLVASGAQASSYMDTGSVVHDPIQYKAPAGGDHPYSGPNLQDSVSAPGAQLPNADLSNATLWFADLSGADLSGADLENADLPNANLSGADLTGANLVDVWLQGANLSSANLSGADLSEAIYLGETTGIPNYDAYTDFTNAWSGDTGSSTLFDPVAAGWNLVSEPVPAISPLGQIALVLLMAGLATAGILIRQRRRASTSLS
jgi:hypothetical protein